MQLVKQNSHESSTNICFTTALLSSFYLSINLHLNMNQKPEVPSFQYYLPKRSTFHSKRCCTIILKINLLRDEAVQEVTGIYTYVLCVPITDNLCMSVCRMFHRRVLIAPVCAQDKIQDVDQMLPQLLCLKKREILYYKTHETLNAKNRWCLYRPIKKVIQ